MQKMHDNSSRKRLLKILISLIERPFCHTVQHWADEYNVHKDTIREDFDELRNAGFDMKFDKQYRYGITYNKAYEQLREMLFFTENEQDFLLEALNKMSHADKRLEKVRRKLETIYDVSKLGSSMITKPFLTKVSMLEKAKANKYLVKLINYRSTNSSEMSDRLVEPFNISPKDDILHTFDVEKKEIRHFRISRIERVEIVEVAWNYENKHYTKATDPFRIVDDQQIKVHLRVKTGGYNELTERFPLTQAYLYPSADEAGIYDFECNVNHKFYGLSNFILGYHEHIVEIVEPETLLEHIEKEIKKINF